MHSSLQQVAHLTTKQLLGGARKEKKRKQYVAALQGAPNKKAVCLRVYTTAPKKPNSANRKLCKVQLSNGFKVLAYIPGMCRGLTDACTQCTLLQAMTGHSTSQTVPEQHRW